jgi:hypothetical protein
MKFEPDYVQIQPVGVKINLNLHPPGLKPMMIQNSNSNCHPYSVPRNIKNPRKISYFSVVNIE